ncbi:MAG: protein kinase, partial [Parachlamydiaceae bacterium]|nr:protein kinase [Parachlamydiaceae bacterium]
MNVNPEKISNNGSISNFTVPPSVAKKTEIQEDKNINPQKLAASVKDVLIEKNSRRKADLRPPPRINRSTVNNQPDKNFTQNNALAVKNVGGKIANQVTLKDHQLTSKKAHTLGDNNKHIPSLEKKAVTSNSNLGKEMDAFINSLDSPPDNHSNRVETHDAQGQPNLLENEEDSSKSASPEVQNFKSRLDLDVFFDIPDDNLSGKVEKQPNFIENEDDFLNSFNTPVETPSKAEDLSDIFEAQDAEDNEDDFLLEEEEINFDCDFVKGIVDDFDFKGWTGELDTLSEPTYYPLKDTTFFAAVFTPGEGLYSGTTVLSNKQLGTGSGSVVYLGKNFKGDKETLIAFKKMTAALSDNEIEINKIVSQGSSTRLVRGVPMNYFVTDFHNRSVATMGITMDYEHGSELSSILNELPRSNNPMEFLEGFNLHKEINGNVQGDIPLDNIFNVKKTIAKGVAEAIKDFHALNMVHGDIKPENILITKNGEVKLYDYGSASIVGDSSQLRICTQQFRPPEANKGTAELAVDSWSLGCILTEMFFGPDFCDGWAKFQNDNKDSFDTESTMNDLENLKQAIFSGTEENEK